MKGRLAIRTQRGQERLALSAAAFLIVVAGFISAEAAHAYTFGEPAVRQFGPEATVYDWTTDKCNSDDIPDQPTRAFRDVNNQVILVNSHHTTRRYQGATLATVAHTCSTMMGSGKNTDPSLFDDREWLGSTWTADGETVYGVIHSEYQGYNHEPLGYCIKSGETFADKAKCWYNTLTLTKSANNGATFQHATPPSHFLAGPPYTYDEVRQHGPAGYFQPSNIVRGRDGYLYLITHVQDYGAQAVGTCLMRTNNIDDPRSWRLWDGAGFTRTSVDPYRTPGINPEDHICTPIAPHTGTLSESLTWSTYFKKWIRVGSWQGPGAAPYPDSGFYYFLSDDLVNWSNAKLLMRGRLPWTFQCSDGAEQVRDPSLLDNESPSRNFDTTGQRPFVYFTRFQVSGCKTSLDRDLVRVPLEFSNQEPGGPSAALTASTLSPQPAEPVTFDAGGSKDSDGGAIAAYKWDLDGDGTYERDTGTSPVTTKTYAAERDVTVTVRVCDDEGKATDETTVLVVGSGGRSPAPAHAGADAAGGACPAGDAGSSAGTEHGSTAPAGAPTDAVRAAGTPLKPGTLRLLGRPRPRAGGTLLKVRVPSAGLLSVRGAAKGSAIRHARRHAAKAGVLRLVVRPSKALGAALQGGRTLHVKVILRFDPVAGKAQSSTLTVPLRRARVR